MPDTPPFWAAPALLAAVIAAVGFVGKIVADMILRLRDAARYRRSALTELYALLRAGDAAFAVQRQLRTRLAHRVRTHHPDSAEETFRFDRLFSATYHVMDDEERQIHSLIRAVTVHTFRPLNQALLDWLRADRYFRAIAPSHPKLGPLAGFLAQLEAHLILWIAKYEAWMPSHAEHALVYLADEEKHGVGFPRNGTRILRKVLDHQESEHEPAEPLAEQRRLVAPPSA